MVIFKSKFVQVMQVIRLILFSSEDNLIIVDRAMNDETVTRKEKARLMKVAATKHQVSPFVSFKNS